MTTTLEALIRVLTQPAFSEEDITAAGRAFLDAVRTTPREGVAEALDRLSTLLDLDDVFRAGYVALVMGAVLEGGYDGRAIGRPLIERLRRVLTACSTFGTRCRELLGDREVDEDDLAEAFNEAAAEVARVLPNEADAWAALELFWRPAVALFSIDTDARRAARPLSSLTSPIAEYHEGAGWLDTLLATPIAEPLLVIEPESRHGFQGTMTGIADNFQLHTLLMDAFPAGGLLARRRVARRIVDVAKGKGPQQTDDAVTGAWNLYAWTAIRADLQLPPAADTTSSRHWIWGEGRPEDIPLFEGQRVILLGPSSYTRSWASQRSFARLPAEIVVAKTLQTDEVTAWLQRLAAAAAGQAG